MRVFSTLRLTAFILGTVAAVSLVDIKGQTTFACDQISQDVSAAVIKEPSRVLMIVEDAMVINEGCAAEITRAAIIAAKADAALANEIVQTGIAVAPKMAAVITEAASAAVPGAVTSQTELAVALPSLSESPDKNPLPVMASREVEPDEDEFTPFSSGVRGIYLIQPPPSGYPPCDVNRKCNHVPTSPCGCTP